jgi:hypothetical protein
MKFYVEIEAEINKYRLQTDHSWKKIDSKELSKTDLLTSDICELIKLQEIDENVVLDGKEWKLNSTSMSFGENNYAYYGIYTKRKISPLIPSKEQLKSVLAQGDDRINNTLILNAYGLFELREFNTLNLSFKDPSIVMRNETFIAGNGYVGNNVIGDDNYVNQLYRNALSFWLMHLKSGKTNFYSDVNTNQTESELINEIENVELH